MSLSKKRSLCSALALILLAVIAENWGQAAHADSTFNPRTDYFSQTLVGTNSGYAAVALVVTQHRLIHRFFDRTQYRLYGGAFLDQDFRTITQLNPLLGIESRVLSQKIPSRLFAEYRQLIRFRERTQSIFQSDHDLRVGSWAYDHLKLSSMDEERQRPHLFAEYYAEALYTSFLNDNWLANGWIRPGVRQPLPAQIDADLYLELTGGEDTNRLAGYEFAYLRAGLRVGRLIRLSDSGLLSWALLGDRMLARFYGNYGDWRGQLIVAAQF